MTKPKGDRAVSLAEGKIKSIPRTVRNPPGKDRSLAQTLINTEALFYGKSDDKPRPKIAEEAPVVKKPKAAKKAKANTVAAVDPGGQGEAALDDKPFADCQLGLVPQVPHDKIDKQDRRCNNE